MDDCGFVVWIFTVLSLENSTLSELVVFPLRSNIEYTRASSQAFARFHSSDGRGLG